MQVRHNLVLPFGRDAVWAALQDVEAVATCLPGASLDGPVADGALRGRLAVKLGPVQATFAGTGTIAMDAAAYAGTLTGSGGDGQSGSRAKGSARLALIEASAEATHLEVTLDYELTGALAQFGRVGIVQDLMGRIARQFAANLGQRIAQSSAAIASVPPSPAPKLDLLALLRAALADWFRRWRGRLQSPR